MAAKKTAQSDMQWISITLSDVQTKDMKKQLPNAEVIMDSLLKLVEAGYKVSVGWDKFNKAHGAWCFPDKGNEDNSNKCLTARGSSPLNAIRGLVYRHYAIFDGDWGARESGDVDLD